MLNKKAILTSKKICSVAPTRSGKTIMFADMSRRMEDAGKYVLVLTHRQEIFDQTFLKFSEFGISAGQIKSDKLITRNLIQLGMIQTVHKRLQKQEKMKKRFKNFTIIKKPDLIIIDECHHTVSKTWKEVLDYFDDVPRIGFTATPERLDGTGLIEVFDTMVIGRSTQWMVDNHWLSRPVHLCPPSPLDKANLKLRMGDYDKQSQTDIMKKHVVCADVVKSYREFFNGAPVIVFCCTIEHAITMTEAYERDGWKPAIIHGKMTKKQRNDSMDGFRSGKYQLLISVDLIGEGVDVPAAAGVQLLRKTKSLSLYLQMSARGMTPVYADGYNLEDDHQRKKALQEGKPESIILDHAGNFWNHGSILKEREWSIDHKKRNNREKQTIKKITCPVCAFSWEVDTKICPHCGHSFDVAARQKKEFEMHELKEKLINVNDIEKMQAESLSKVILRIKTYDNKRNAMFKILHNSIRDGEINLKNKIAAMTDGLGYKSEYKYSVWKFLRGKYGAKLDDLA
jgi:superfamily II DNA or RNA helicase